MPEKFGIKGLIKLSLTIYSSSQCLLRSTEWQLCRTLPSLIRKLQLASFTLIFDKIIIKTVVAFMH